jgi:hypothetical protein
MYRLSKQTDLSFLVGIQLLQVCVGRNEVILNFDNDARITILSDFATGKHGDVLHRHQQPTSGALAIFPLLHSTVAQAVVTASGGLLLIFSTAECLEIFDTSSQYESFWIMRGDTKIVV